jgi:hypothetical protein
LDGAAAGQCPSYIAVNNEMLTEKLSFLTRSLKRKSVCDSFSLGQSSGQPSETAIFIDFIDLDCIDLLDGALRNPAFETSLIYAIRDSILIGCGYVDRKKHDASS